MVPIAVLASGHGTNLQALVDAARDYRVACVISDRRGAGALARAEADGIPATFVDPAAFPDRASFDTEIDRLINAHGARFVVLAGFMRILGSAFVHTWQGKMVNVHPSLLPKYRGLDTHRRALAAGDCEHGASVHFVTDELDGGPVILQATVPLRAGDDVASVAARVQAQEHRVYPFVVQLLAQQRVTLSPDGVLLDGRRIDAPLRVDAATDLACVAA
ncbi:MAG: phosphoribosylglycinamide formyltransferase [Xanthomonadaceae bacterium]|nr:phosphoribosylglycinamide formyltransferase [Xanthomonadaceae bacterium]